MTRACSQAAMVWWLVLGTVACSDGGESHRSSAVETDSVGVRQVISASPLWDSGEGWHLTPEPLLSLGGVDAPFAQQFHHIEGVTRMSDGTIVVLNTASGQLRAFDSGGNHLWNAGGLGSGPGEMTNHQGKRLLRLPDDTLMVISGNYWITFDPDGKLVDHRMEPEEDGCRRLRIPAIGDRYLTCGRTRSDGVPGPWTRENTIVRIAQDRVDSLGPFFMGDGWQSRSTWIRSPLGPKGKVRFAPGEPTLLYARDDAYRIEFWDLAAGRLSMVVERLTPRVARSEADILLELRWGINDPAVRPTLRADDDRLSVADSLSIVNNFFLDELGFLWVRRSPAPGEGDEGIPREWFTPDSMERIGVVWDPSGLHDVFRPDGVYLGTVQLPPDLRGPGIIDPMGVEIGADYVLGITRDEWGVEHVTMFGLERGRAASQR